MRVLYVETAPGFGGSLSAILDTIDYLPSHVEPILAISYEPRLFRPVPERLDCRVLDLTPPRPEPSNARWSWLLKYASRVRSQVKQLDRLVKDVRPDILHANNQSASNLASAIVGRRRAIPVISHQRGGEYDGLPNRLIIRTHLFHHHIAVSDAIARTLIGLGLPPARCSTIYDAIIPPPDRLPGPRKGEGRELVVAMYSMLLPWKGQEVFLRAVARLIHEAGDPFRVVIGGSEPGSGSGYRAALERLAAELGIDSHVVFPGYCRDIYGELAKTDVLVLASVDPEPGGHIVQEAMMCGVPVVTTDDGGPSEYVNAADAGIVVPRGDVERLAEAIKTLIGSADLRERFIQRGLDYARREFEPNAIVRRWMEIYDHALGQGRKTPAHRLTTRLEQV